MAANFWTDLIGTSLDYLRIGKTGPRLKNVTGNLVVRNPGDTGDAELTASKVSISGDVFDLNSDAAGSGADWKYTLQRPASGMGAAVVLTLPVDDGTPGQVLSTDGSGILSWISAASTAAAIKVDKTALAFGDGSPIAMFSTGLLDEVAVVRVYVDTAFNGTAPTLSIGISGSVSKYMPTTAVDLKTTGMYEYHANLAAAGVEALIATYVPDSSSAGAARIEVEYMTPS